MELPGAALAQVNAEKHHCRRKILLDGEPVSKDEKAEDNGKNRDQVHVG